MVGPFIFMDHAGPVNIQPTQSSNMDVLPWGRADHRPWRSKLDDVESNA